MATPLPPQSDFGVDVGENPERLARNAARKAAARAAMAAKKAEIKRIMAEGRPQIDAARAEREAAAERNAAQYGGLSQAAISSALNKAMYAQGASAEARRAAMQNLVSGSQKAPRDIRGNTDIGSIMQIVSQYATPDQLNAALKASGRSGMFNAFDTYNTGVSGATQRLNDLIAARDARAGVGIKKPVRPMTPSVEDTVGVNAEAGIPLWMRLGLPRPAEPAMPQADTGFNINNAMNTFNQSLGQRVASGQMTMDQARAAQAEMTALQRTANPTREQATNVAQSQLQVGQYAPQPGMPRMDYGYPIPEAPQPMPKMVQPPMAVPGGNPNFNESTGVYTPQFRGLANFFRGTPMMSAKPVARPYVFDAGIGDGTMPRQPSGVDNSTFMAGDPNFRFGQTPQQMAPNAQGMAMGGLMRKYGGMC
ncbi:MAG: hypothetical protein QM519_01380 [Bacteroidia bacterium]|nr:hypothetical protein [Bacteroidia bacterium]